MGARNVHLIGIGGVGMSALAQAYLDAGYGVSGADRALNDPSAPHPPTLEALARQGVALRPDDGAGVAAGLWRVVVSTAIEADNPGLAAAARLGVPVVHRAAALADLLAGRKLVAVAGTCGKSTVTAMLGHVLAVCGFDPAVVNGAQVVGWDRGGARVGSVRPGAGGFAVAEVDESDRSLTAFRPYAAVVTNASADHYSKEEMDAVFDAFIHDVPGPVIDGRRPVAAPDDDAAFRAAAARCPLPGAHNRANAELALRMAAALGAPRERLGAAIASFPGVERRLQKISGDGAWAAVYDDYAHNSEKLRAMLLTLQEEHPAGVAVLWRPHGYAPLRKMADALAAMFRDTLRAQDALVLPPVYDAGGTADRSVNSDALAARLADAAAPVRRVADLDEGEAALAAFARPGGCAVTAGARDPALPGLARRLAGRFANRKGHTT